MLNNLKTGNLEQEKILEKFEKNLNFNSCAESPCQKIFGNSTKELKKSVIALFVKGLLYSAS